MKLEHTFTVPADIEQAWQVLLDIELIAPCMPGAALDSVDGDDFTGSVKVRLGPIGLTYKGKASFIEKDESVHRAVIDARAKDARGNGTAAAKITATLKPSGDGTAVHVLTDLNVTGKPAQFGRGVMADVGNKLIGQFADCLAGKLSGPNAAEPAVAAAAGEPAVVPEISVMEEVGIAPEAAVTEQLPVIGNPPDSAEPAGDQPDAEQANGEQPIAGQRAEDLPVDDIADDDVADAVLAEAGGPTLAGAPDTGIAAASSTSDGRAGAQPPTRQPYRSSPEAEVEPIDLLGSAGPAVAKRLAPWVVGLVVLVLLLMRRRRSPRYPAKGGFDDAAWLPSVGSPGRAGQLRAVGSLRRGTG